jgi:D-threo-aldose 1-dehydrogenase
MDRIGIALIHDVDIWTHGPAEAYERRFRQALDGAYRALDELRRSGVVGAIGVGINEVAPCVRFANEAAFDCFLLAGRYTLLDRMVSTICYSPSSKTFRYWLAAQLASYRPIIR